MSVGSFVSLGALATTSRTCTGEDFYLYIKQDPDMLAAWLSEVFQHIGQPGHGLMGSLDSA
jgi:hypothetical protein